MNIKKGLAIALIIVVMIAGVLVLTGCEKKDNNANKVVSNSTSTNNSTSSTTTTTNTSTDTSTNDSAIVGSWKNDSWGSDYIYTFNSDGTGKYDAAGNVMHTCERSLGIGTRL